MNHRRTWLAAASAALLVAAGIAAWSQSRPSPQGDAGGSTVSVRAHPRGDAAPGGRRKGTSVPAKPVAERVEGQVIDSDAEADRLLELYQDLSRTASGPGLVAAQEEMITRNAFLLSPENAVKFYLEVALSSSDPVIGTASSVLANRIFRDGLQQGFAALAGMDDSAAAQMLAQAAGVEMIRSKTFTTADAMMELSGDSTLPEKVRAATAKGALQGAFARGQFNPDLADALFSGSDRKLYTPEELASWMNTASQGDAFAYAAGKYGAQVPPAVRDSLYRGWARTDPQSCAKTLAASQNVELLRSQAGTVVQGWCDSSPRQAGEWAMSLTDPQAKVEAASAMSLKLADLSPDEAIGWANSIQDENARLLTLKWIGKKIPKDAMARAGVTAADLEKADRK